MLVAPPSTSFTTSRFEEKGKGVDRLSVPWASDFEKLVEHAQADREVEKNVDKVGRSRWAVFQPGPYAHIAATSGPRRADQPNATSR
jgi:hypothetical protein